MPESNFDVKVVGVQYDCDVCKTGEMVYTGKLDLAAEGERKDYIFPHQCNNPDCKHEETFKEKYPTIRHFKAGVNNG